ncbi:cbb3-type cytochrome oxidase assembly protein CcoS [Caenispirillum bisanense]|uniref:cbb3-type cytochrome oxidase assembly protein CcoS n=1 Tax=Caenispirillum bisanense TaxID=414052 RepID=UPI0031D91D66
MDSLLMLIPVALLLGLLGLGGFLWALRSGQFDDLDGAANRILFEEDDMKAPPPGSPAARPAEPDPTAGPVDPTRPADRPS